MRYFAQGSLLFTRAIDPDSTREIKETLPIGDQDDFTSVSQTSILGEQQLDHIASDVFGPGAEWQWYLIANRNARQIMGWRGDFTYILQVDIPDVTEYNN